MTERRGHPKSNCSLTPKPYIICIVVIFFTFTLCKDTFVCFLFGTCTCTCTWLVQEREREEVCWAFFVLWGTFTNKLPNSSSKVSLVSSSKLFSLIDSIQLGNFFLFIFEWGREKVATVDKVGPLVQINLVNYHHYKKRVIDNLIHEGEGEGETRDLLVCS